MVNNIRIEVGEMIRKKMIKQALSSTSVLLERELEISRILYLPPFTDTVVKTLRNYNMRPTQLGKLPSDAIPEMDLSDHQ